MADTIKEMQCHSELFNDGTLFVQVDSLNTIERTNRIIIKSGCWCGTFYPEDDSLRRVVLCEDCKHWEKEGCYCHLDAFDHAADDYCSNGERNERQNNVQERQQEVSDTTSIRQEEDVSCL